MAALIPQLAPLLGLDGSHTGQRRQRRYVRAALTSVFTALNRGVAALTLLVSVPLTVKYLGAERYGIWLALSSLIAIMVHVDLGLSSGLVNAVSAADGSRDEALAERAVSSVFFMLAGLAIGLSSLLLLIYRWLPFSRLVHVISPTAAAEVGPSLCALAICFFLSMPLTVGIRVQIAYQEGYKASWWQSTGSLLGLAALVLAIRLRASLPWLVLATTAMPVLTSAVNCIHQFSVVRPHLRPKWTTFQWHTARHIVRSGLLFCLAQLAAILTAQIPYLMITRILGPAAVARYGVAQKLLSLLPVLASVATYPLWPAYREALASGDVPWIVRTFRLTLQVTLAISLSGAAIFLLSYRKVISVWVNPDVAPDFSTALALSILLIATSLKWTTWMCLNGCNRLRSQAIYPYPIILAACTAAALAWQRYGISGIVWPFALAECLILAAQAIDLFIGLPGIRAAAESRS